MEHPDIDKPQETSSCSGWIALFILWMIIFSLVSYWLVQKKNTVENKLEQSGKQYVDIRLQLSKARQENTRIRWEMEDIADKLKTLQEELEYKQDVQEKLQEKYSQTKAQLQQLKNRYSQESSQNLRERFQALSKRYAALEQQHRQLQEEMAKKSPEIVEKPVVIEKTIVIKQDEAERQAIVDQLKTIKQEALDLSSDLQQATTGTDSATAVSLHTPPPTDEESTPDIEKDFQEIKSRLSDARIHIEILKKRFTVFRLNNDILFNPGDALLKPAGQAALNKIADILLQYPDKKIAVEGHTDNRPIHGDLKKRYHSNWNLSAARAASAIHYLQHVAKIPPERMILVAYSAYHPITENTDAEHRARNRRIEITLLPENFAFFERRLPNDESTPENP